MFSPFMEDILTKRSILGRVAIVFDPLCLASPFMVRAKILIQDLWSMGLSWAKSITRQISVRAKEWFLELEELKEIKVPRSLREPKVGKSSSVHPFKANEHTTTGIDGDNFRLEPNDVN